MTDGAAVSRRRQLVSLLLAGLVIVAVAWTVVDNWSDFVDSWQRIGVVGGLAALAFATGGVALTWLQWRAVLEGLDVRFEPGTSARVFFVSQLGKYVPGSVWPIVLQTEAGKRQGASRTTIVAANLIVLAISLTSGLAVAAVLLPFAAPGAMGRFWWALAALPLVLLAAHPSTLPGLLDWFLQRIGRAPLGVRLSGRATATAMAWSVGSWVLNGAHVAVLMAAMGASGWEIWALGVGGTALAVCAGVLFIPAPAGAGAREVVLGYAVATVLTGGAVLAVVVASRVLLIAADLLLAGLGALGRRAR